MLGAVAIAVHAEVPVDRLRSMIHAYPTFHRGIDAVLAALDRPAADAVPGVRRAHEMRRLVRTEQAVERDMPLGRLGIPEEVAPWVAALASPLASYVTGAPLDLAGGLGVRP